MQRCHALISHFFMCFLKLKQMCEIPDPMYMSMRLYNWKFHTKCGRLDRCAVQYELTVSSVVGYVIFLA